MYLLNIGKPAPYQGANVQSIKMFVDFDPLEMPPSLIFYVKRLDGKIVGLVREGVYFIIYQSYSKGFLPSQLTIVGNELKA